MPFLQNVIIALKVSGFWVILFVSCMSSNPVALYLYGYISSIPF